MTHLQPSFYTILNNTSPQLPHYTYSILQAILSLLAALGLFAGAGLLLLFGIVGLLGSAPQIQAIPLFLFAAGLAACGLLLVPSVYFAFRRVTGRPVLGQPRLARFLRPSWLLLAFLVLILLGAWISRWEQFSLLLLPPIHVLAVGIPVLFIVYLAVRGLPLGTPQRFWGVFGSGLVLGPLLILMLETIFLVIYLLIGYLYLSAQADLLSQLNNLAESFLQQQEVMPEEVLQQLAPWLAQPGVIVAVIVFVSLIVPLIEEAFKPVGVWLLAGFKLTPMAGFVAGALSGAGYAFFESLALTTSAGDWAVLVGTRAATAVIHILNTGLMGWALVLAWREKRYMNLALTYILVVVAHGLWNGLAVLNVVDSLLVQANLTTQLSLVDWIGPLAPFIIGGITIAMFIILILINNRLRKQTAAQGLLSTAEVIESPSLSSIDTNETGE